MKRFSWFLILIVFISFAGKVSAGEMISKNTLNKANAYLEKNCKNYCSGFYWEKTNEGFKKQFTKEVHSHEEKCGDQWGEDGYIKKHCYYYEIYLYWDGRFDIVEIEYNYLKYFSDSFSAYDYTYEIIESSGRWDRW